MAKLGHNLLFNVRLPPASCAAGR